MGSISVTFTGSTIEEVAGLVAAWRPPVTRRSDGANRAAAASVPPADAGAAIGRVLSGVNGMKSRRLLRLLAEAGMKGEVVTLSASLVSDFGVSGGTAFAGTVLLTHLHWDHVHGLPFFTAGDREDARVALFLPEQPDGVDATEVLARAVEHHALHADNAVQLVNLFAEARFSSHEMNERHRELAVGALRVVLNELGSRSAV